MTVTGDMLTGMITTHEARALTGYSLKYLEMLAARGTVKALKVGRTWLLERESLLDYTARSVPGKKWTG